MDLGNCRYLCQNICLVQYRVFSYSTWLEQVVQKVTCLPCPNANDTRSISTLDSLVSACHKRVRYRIALRWLSVTSPRTVEQLASSFSPVFELLERRISLCGSRQSLPSAEKVTHTWGTAETDALAFGHCRHCQTPPCLPPRCEPFGIPSNPTLESQFRQQRITLNIAGSGLPR